MYTIGGDALSEPRDSLKGLKTVEINCCGISNIMRHKDKNGLDACMFCDEEQLMYPFVTVRAEIHDLHWEKMKLNLTRKYMTKENEQ